MPTSGENAQLALDCSLGSAWFKHLECPSADQHAAPTSALPLLLDIMSPTASYTAVAEETYLLYLLNGLLWVHAKHHISIVRGAANI